MLTYSIALELTILMVFWLCLLVWHRDRSTPGRTTFVALGVSASVWCLGELVYQRGVLDELTADRIRYVGILSLPPLWAGMAGHAARLDLARRVPWYPVVLLAPSACFYAVMFAGPWSGLFVLTLDGVPDQYGPLWWIATGYAYALVLSGSALIAISALRWKAPRRWTRLAAGIAPLAPLAGNAWYIWHGLAAPFDPTPVLFGVAILALHSAIFTGGLLQALPISEHALIEQLPIGVILTDSRGVVIDVNPAAEKRLGMSEAKAVGRNLDAILSESGEETQAEIVPVFSQEREAGQLVLIDPPAKQSED